MPLYKRKPFETKPPPKDLNPEEPIFFFKLTNEIFKDHDEYFDRVIMCNSLVWSCALTGRTGLTYEEAVDCEKDAKRILTGFPKALKKALLYLMNQTNRGRVLDACEDVVAYAREHYFIGEEVLAVIGNLWCHSKVIRIIPPTASDIETYRKEQEEKGTLEKDDYLRDDSWGPPPDLFRYEVEETDPDTPDTNEVHILEAIDVKREKTILTKDKVKYLLKLSTDYDPEERVFRVKSDIWKGLNLEAMRFQDIFIGECPKFEPTLGPIPSKGRKSTNEPKKSPTVSPGSKENKNTTIANGQAQPAKKGTGTKATAGLEVKPKKPKKQLTPEQLKQLEFERRAKEREELKAKKKVALDFKKLWFKPKEDLEVEDLKDLPTPDPVHCKIPNNLFGPFMMILEFFNCYSGTLKVRDSFPSGIGFDALERALTKIEVAGPLSDILQLLLRGLFRLQETENAETTQFEKAAVGLDIDDSNDDITAALAIQQATAAASWSLQYQNTPLHKLPLDHLSLTEVLRLHLLSSGAEPSDKDVKWRFQMRGGYTSRDDPGIQIRLEEPRILKTLSQGTIFDLTLYEKIKVIECLINQILSYVPIRDVIDESFEEFKQARISLRTIQAAEKRKETEDHLWRQKLKADKLVPDENFMKSAVKADAGGEDDEVKIIPNNKIKGANSKPVELLGDRQIEILLEKRDRETARRKQNYEYEVEKLMQTINKNERKLGLHPIGKDRAYRRYWIFQSLPGLFVEQDDENVGTCLSEPTPYIDNVDIEDWNFINKHFEKLKQAEKEASFSDKEYSTIKPVPKKIAKKKSVSKELIPTLTPRPPTFGICNSDPESCPVHNILLPHSKWSFYWNSEQLESLIAGLTPRGVREKELRTHLQDEKSGIESVLLKCPVVKLNTEKKYPEIVVSASERRPQRSIGASKNSVDPNLNFPTGTPIETILDLQLRDLILEFEEKICLGVLGNLKVNDRATWRKAIENRGYDKQTSHLRWGSNRFRTRNPTLPPDQPSSSSSAMKRDDDETSSIASSSSTSENNPKDQESNPLIKDLASAILQLEQSLEPKFLKKPLGIEKEDDKKKKSKSGDGGDASSKDTHESPVERWETSLMNSTSFSQLFMHLFTLDNSVEWNRSVLNARCRVCRRKGDGENMLLCDNCNKGHHLYCLRPTLEKIPKESWYCVDCKPPELEPRVVKQNRKTFIEEEDENEGSEDDESKGDYDNEDDVYDDIGPPRLEASGLEPEVCEVCQVGGEVICCDSCPRVYHLECLNPPKTRVPRGSWYCDYCTNPKNKKDKSSGSKTKKAKTKHFNKASKPKRARIIYSDSEEDSEEEEEEEDEETSPEDTTVGEDDDEEAISSLDGDSGAEDSEPQPVKVRFPGTPRKRSSALATRSVDDDEEDNDFAASGSRGGKRSAARQAAVKIEQALRLRSDSKENETSDYSNSNDSTSTSSGGFQSRKRSHESRSPGDDDMDHPKRTRLQRMNTNRCGDSGDLDNVLLDKLISDVMKQPDAWPFLKPVTRAEAPDYHDIIKSPMDLGTIKYKLNSMVYTCNQEFLADLQLIFDNCFTYNPVDNTIYKAGETLQSYCERRCSKFGLHFSGPE